MTQRMVIVGAGGLGRETLDIVDASNRQEPGRFDVVGIVDDAPTALHVERVAARGVPLLGGVEAWAASEPDADYVIAIGDPIARARVQRTLDDAGLRATTVVHPTATIGSLVRLAAGAIVGAGVHLSTNVDVGEHSYLGTASVVGHDVSILPFASVLAGAVISGDVTLGAQSVVGAGAVVLQGLVVGARASVGAAACVTHDVPEASVRKGVPAR